MNVHMGMSTCTCVCTIFCLSYRRRTPTPPPPPEPVEDVPHNVVVPLPYLDHTRGCLVRLGETHCSKCHPERETGLGK